MWVTFKVLLVLFYELGEMNILLHSFIILVSYYLKLTIIVDPISELFLVLTDLGRADDRWDRSICESVGCKVEG